VLLARLFANGTAGYSAFSTFLICGHVGRFRDYARTGLHCKQAKKSPRTAGLN
jgi:hypothetical protein